MADRFRKTRKWQAVREQILERDYHMTLKEQLESIAEDYEGFEYICVSCRKITFMYEKEKECA